MFRALACLLFFCLSASAAQARSSIAAGYEPGSAAERVPGRHVLYLELLGKGGLYALGYDYQLGERLGVGAALSAYQIDGERDLVLNPYLSLYPLRSGHHGWFAQLGPRLLHRRVKSPVAGWDGLSSTALGGQLSTGYEYRNRMVARVFAMAVVGKGGVAPWGGASLGVAF